MMKHIAGILRLPDPSPGVMVLQLAPRNATDKPFHIRITADKDTRLQLSGWANEDGFDEAKLSEDADG